MPPLPYSAFVLMKAVNSAHTTRAECDEFMKVFMVTVSIFILLTAFSYGLDLYQGFDPRTAFSNALSPFKVMELIEICVFILLVSMFVLQSVLQLFTKKKSQ